MKGLNRQSSLDAFRELTLKEDQRLEEVWQRVEDGCRDFIALRFSAGVLTLAADADDDTVEVRCQEAETFDPTGLAQPDSLAPWSSWVGRPFGGGWVAVNQQGYPDGVLLSFDGLDPSILIVVTASSMYVYPVGRPMK